MKNVVKAVTAAAVAALMLTGCAEKEENDYNGVFDNVIENVSSIFANSDAKTEMPGISSNTGSEESEKPVNIPKPVESSSEPAEKPVESSPAHSSTVRKPAESSVSSSTIVKPAESSVSSSTIVKPAESSVSSSTIVKPAASSSTKPVEKPVHTHNFTIATCEKPATCTTCGTTQGTVANHNYKNGICTNCGKNDPNYVKLSYCEKWGHDYSDSPADCNDTEDYHTICSRCGATHKHDWDITLYTTEPKWCREMHIVYDHGFDVTLFDRLYPDKDMFDSFDDAYEKYGIKLRLSSCTRDVEVWGTETYESGKCKECNLSYSNSFPTTITPLTVTPEHPLGEWRFIDGINNCRNGFHIDDVGKHSHPDNVYQFNTLFYDPYNIPQSVVDNIACRWGYSDILSTVKYVVEEKMTGDKRKYWLGTDEYCKIADLWEEYLEERQNPNVIDTEAFFKFEKGVSSIPGIRDMFINAWFSKQKN